MDLARGVELDGTAPSRILRPTSAEEVSAALRDAGERGERLSPFGGATHFEIGHVLERVDVALDMSALSGIVQYEPDDMTIAVEAGMTASMLEATLAAHGRCLFLDVEEPERATLGGMVAAGVVGPRRLGHGTLRDSLIGARAVLADGTIVKTGGMVVKNVAGYDLTKLLHGSLGSIAVIVEVNFKVQARPAEQLALSFAFADTSAAVAAARALAESRLPFAALHVDSEHRLRVGCDGHSADVARLRAECVRSARGFNGVVDGEALGAQEAAGVWRAHLRAPFANRTATFRIHALPSDSGAALDEADRVARDLGFVPSWRADVGCGGVELSVDTGECKTAESVAGLERALVDAFGNVRTMRCPASWRAGLSIFGSKPGGFSLMRALKAQFDPSGVLNVGKNVGRL